MPDDSNLNTSPEAEFSNIIDAMQEAALESIFEVTQEEPVPFDQLQEKPGHILDNRFRVVKSVWNVIERQPVFKTLDEARIKIARTMSNAFYLGRFEDEKGAEIATYTNLLLDIRFDFPNGSDYRMRVTLPVSKIKTVLTNQANAGQVVMALKQTLNDKLIQNLENEHTSPALDAPDLSDGFIISITKESKEGFKKTNDTTKTFVLTEINGIGKELIGVDTLNFFLNSMVDKVSQVEGADKAFAFIKVKYRTGCELSVNGKRVVYAAHDHRSINLGLLTAHVPIDIITIATHWQDQLTKTNIMGYDGEIEANIDERRHLPDGEDLSAEELMDVIMDWSTK